jgi:hypothetical protein
MTGDAAMNFKTTFLTTTTLALGILAGCQGRTDLFPNSDKNLQKTSTEFAADAAKRFPFPESAPSGGTADGRVAVDLMLKRIQILNSSPEDWKEIDVWVNRSHVCHIPIIPAGKEKVETVMFSMLYNAQGNYFTTEDGKNPVNRVEILKDGKLYTIPLRLAD